MLKVSIIVPCRNETTSIEALLKTLLAQTFPTKNMEVLIADGMSTDGTREKIEKFQREHKELRIRLVDNEKTTIPAALNKAIAVAKGEFILRMDAHALPSSDYVALCVKALGVDKGDVVGGVWVSIPGGNGMMARSIARAVVHPLGVGDAFHRYAKRPRFVDTVSLGACRRSLFSKVGLFNEKLLANEDYEFNSRVRQMGGKIWLDPAIKFRYMVKPRLRDLAKQYSRYGFWKGVMLKKNPGTLRWRQALPPLFILSIIAGLTLGLVWGWLYVVLAILLSLYFITLLTAGLLVAAQEADIGLALGLPTAIATMHLCWGEALIWSLLVGKRI